MADQTTVKQTKPARKKGQTQFQMVMKRLWKNPRTKIGLGIILFFAICAIFAPILAPYDYQAMDVTCAKQGPSAEHWFGTDELGRDILSRLMYGGRFSLSLGVLSVAFSAFVAIIIGSIAGYYGGKVDMLLMRFLDCVTAIPAILLAVILSAVLGVGFLNTVLALGIACIAGMSRLLRAQVLSVRNKEFVEAARSTNCSTFRIMFSHILPNSIMPLIVNATGMMAVALLFAASLSFIGLGVQPPDPEWGAMLAGARSFVRTYPHMLIFPGLCICLTIIGFNTLGDALRDALDPKLKK